MKEIPNFDTSELDRAGLVPLERPDSTKSVLESGGADEIRKLDEKYSVNGTSSEKKRIGNLEGQIAIDKASSFSELMSILDTFDTYAVVGHFGLVGNAISTKDFKNLSKRWKI